MRQWEFLIFTKQVQFLTKLCLCFNPQNEFVTYCYGVLYQSLNLSSTSNGNKRNHIFSPNYKRDDGN